jgi:isoleucyl-tRNA synthetase
VQLSRPGLQFFQMAEASSGTKENEKLESFYNTFIIDRFDFPAEEDKILKFWDEIDAFQTSLKLSEGRPAYTFIDGPPFATGLPHYGHILAGTIKDVVTRYASLNGFHVERKFGWDCHGLPVEYEIDKKCNITCKADVMKMGIPAYNAECRSIVSRYSQEWEATVRRMARWIDFKNDYKTMYPEFMESIWWVFKTLFEKGQIYRKYRVMPFSTACNTPLSNFEVALNYKDVQDPSLTFTCPLRDAPEAFLGAAFLVWTTTPWTLPSNLALAVNPELEYVMFEDLRTESQFKSKRLIALKERLSAYFKDLNTEISIISSFKGSELVGFAYEAPFDCYVSRREQFPKTHTVLAADYVSAESGTGIVHQAPGFGEDDFNVCFDAGVITETDVPCPVDEAGCYVAPIPETIRGEPLRGKYVKDADSWIIKDLEDRARVFLRTTLTHSYPFCWRSDTPLLYRTVPCWFVRVTNIIPQMLEASAETYWIPEFVQEKRFHNWLSQARDWAISRNRYWGTPIPLWANEEFSEIVCIGSVEELERLTGVTGIKDLHRESIDHLTIPSKSGNGVLRRVEEVLDCWFESGSVPYGQLHYPFENKDKFEASFPYDFIGEGLDQTRGWFYTLVVLGTHLFGKAPFKNLICNGLVLAADGKKMSKRLKNYPEPGLIFDQHGADALRLYLINSPVVRADPLKFREDGVKDVVKDVLLPWWNSYRFLAGQLDTNFKYDPNSLKSENVMDRWILASLQTLLKTVRTEMEAYRLYAVLPPCLRFLESLTNMYIRFNRRRLKGEQVDEDARGPLNVLFHIILNFSLVMAPFAPLLSENIYQRLLPHIVSEDGKDVRSIHFLDYPKVDETFCDSGIERAVAALEQVIEAGRSLRKSRDIPLKTPLRGLTVVSVDEQFCYDVAGLQSYALDELNVRNIKIDSNEEAYGVSYRATPNFKALGMRLKKDLPKVQAALKSLTQAQLAAFMSSGVLEVAGHELTGDDLQVTRFLASENSSNENSDVLAHCDRSIVVLLDCTEDAELKSEGLAREFVNRIQRLRKAAGLKASDSVSISIKLNSDPEGEIAAALESQKSFICGALKQAPETIKVEDVVVVGEDVLMTGEAEINSATLSLSLLKL